MTIKFTDEFYREFKRLPTKIQNLFRKQEIRFRKHQKDSRLHLKKLAGDSGTFSLRITSSYRALFYFEAESKAIFITIGHRKDVYRKK
ncbi:MAG: hypothetical protein AAB470_01830 [Patescibacteria group bacterium]